MAHVMSAFLGKKPIAWKAAKEVYGIINQGFSNSIFQVEVFKSMKILGVIGSRRKNGNTAALVEEALNAAVGQGIETEMIYLSDYDFKSCNGCEGCRNSFNCIVNDDMQKIYPLIEEADGIILGSPTYFYNITSEMKAFIDRLYCYETFDEEDRSVWLNKNEISGIKYAAVIAVCEQNNEADMGFTADAMKMPLEALGYRVVSTVKALHLFKKEEASESESEKSKAAKAGEKLARTLKLRHRKK